MEFYPRQIRNVTIAYISAPGTPALPKRLWKQNRWVKKRLKIRARMDRRLNYWINQIARAAGPGPVGVEVVRLLAMAKMVPHA